MYKILEKLVTLYH